MAMRNTLPPHECKQCTASRTNQQATAFHFPWDDNLYRDFPVKIARYEYIESIPLFEHHWHEQLQIIYFEQGEAVILCNTNTHLLKPGDVLIINSNEIHYGTANSNHLVYHIIKPNFDFLSSCQQDLCQIKYITPLLQGNILFQNQITQDTLLTDTIRKVINEYTEQNLGFELLIKAYIYHILVYLLRHYQQKNLSSPADHQQKTLHRLRTVLEYIDEHYTESIRLNTLSGLANMSSHNLCCLFKKLTGKSPIDYINCLRINKAAVLLLESDYNMSEIASIVGFDDSNYFSRIFKKYKKVPPTSFRNDKNPLSIG